ncbi:MAG: YcaO-like family protein [Candidatus Riflebacteria bacterium]|nr:YcaO-like family protein [Candidatus Riflebacteria bacterium]
MDRWFESRYTGLFLVCTRVLPRPHDPDLRIWAGGMAPWWRANPSRESGLESREISVGAAGWTRADAEAGTVGEAIERLQTQPLSQDDVRVSTRDRWRWPEPAVDPDRWVLFHPDQYAQAGFPFEPFTGSTECGWVRFRRALHGGPCWVPLDLAFLNPLPDQPHRICCSTSTGLSAGRPGDITRPNLRYRFYRVDSPFSDHVTMVSVEGEDREGFCFSVGSACRSTRRESWEKSILEAIQGRHFVRHRVAASGQRAGPPLGFPDHALYYTLHPEQLRATVLIGPRPAPDGAGEGDEEPLAALASRLGPERPILFRSVTPPALASELRDWYVLRVVVPGLQPLHGNHLLPHLGGPLWAPRGVEEWASMPPHPFG